MYVENVMIPVQVQANDKMNRNMSYFDKYTRLVSGVKLAMAAIVGLTGGDIGLDCTDCKRSPNSFLNFTALPYVRPNLVNISASGSLRAKSLIEQSSMISYSK